jgi:thermitase
VLPAGFGEVSVAPAVWIRPSLVSSNMNVFNRTSLSSFPGLRSTTALTSALVVAATALGNVASAAPAQLSSEGPWAKGRVLVMPRAGVTEAELGRLAGGVGARAQRLTSSGLYVLELPPTASERSVLARLASHPRLKFAELDRVGHLAATANDPYAGSAWHLGRIGVPSAWDFANGAGVTVAVIDTGVDASHPDLAPSLVAGWNFVDNNSNAADVMGHGTKAAGAVAATMNNGIGVAGVAGGARIMPLRVTSADGSFYYSAVAQALTWAADRGAKVANMSIYGALNSASIISAANYMKSKGGLVVTSAGNNGKDEGWAASTSMIPVSATDANDARTSWSSFGTFVAVAAPGVGIWTTVAGNSYGSVNGTSFASPVTAGVVALMFAANPKLTNSDVETLLYKTSMDLGTSGRDPYFGYGRVDAAAAVTAAMASTSTADTTPPTVSFASPTAGASVAGQVAVDVTANDQGGVAKVELRANGSLVGTDTSAPFGFSWNSTTVANGSTTLTATAYDAAGNSTSTQVVVGVANQSVMPPADTMAPTLTIINPTSGLKLGTSLTVVSSADDNAGASALKQSLYIDGKLVATASGGSLSYRWNTRKVTTGSHTVQVVVRDAAGNSTTGSVGVVK